MLTRQELKVGMEVEMERQPVYADSARHATYKITKRTIVSIEDKGDYSIVKFKGMKDRHFNFFRRFRLNDSMVMYNEKTKYILLT